MAAPKAAFALVFAVFALVSLAFAPLASAQDADDIRINLLHGIPGVAVDVFSDDVDLIENFQFGDVNDLTALAGETLADLEVRVAGTEQVVIDAGDVDLPETGNFSIVAHLDEIGEPTLSVFSNNNEQIDAGEGRLTLRHVAATPEVDVLLDGDIVRSGLENGQEITADLDIDTYEVEVRADDDTLVGPDDVMLSEGRSLIVYVVGSNNDQLTTITDRYEVAEDAPAATATPSADSGSGTSSSGGGTGGSSGDGEVTTMTESINGLNSSPAGVDTGIGAVTVTSFSLSRTLIALAIALLAISGGFLGLRRLSDARH